MEDSPTLESLDVERLLQEKAELEAFAAVAAHEMIEPLVVIEAYTTLARERLAEVIDPASFADLEAVCRVAARTRRLMESLLHEMRSPTVPIERHPVDLALLLPECVDVVAPEATIRGTAIILGDLPVVDGDYVLLGGLFVNLLVNAMKYGPREGGEVRVESERAGAEWRVSIGSDGVPLPESAIDEIFEPFRRGPGERRTRGAGLGLAICRRIVERHGGRIGVIPGTDGGNVFYLTLPA